MTGHAQAAVLLPDGASIDALERRARQLHTLAAPDRVEAIAEIQATLSSLTQFTLTRLHLIENCRRALLDSIDDIASTEAAFIVPLDEHSFATVTLLISTLEQVGTEYETLANLLDEAQDDDGIQARQDTDYREAFCMHRHLELLDAMLLVSARAYLPSPAGVWSAAHNIVERSMSLGALDFKPPMDDDALGIGDFYAVMLLVGLADPHRLSLDQNHAVRRYAFNGAAKALLLGSATAPTDGEAQYLFGVDFDLDVPALPWRASRGSSAGASAIDLVLDVSALVVLSRRRQLALRSDPVALDDLLESNRDLTISSSDLEALYKHLVIEWGKQPIRKSPRQTRAESFEVLVGFRAALQAHRVSSSVVEEYEHDAIVLSGGVRDTVIHSHRSTAAPQAGLTSAVSLDVSSTGMRLRITTDNEPALQVGEVLAWRRPGEDETAFRIGVVRWLRSAGPGEVDIGVMILGRVDSSATLTPVSTDSESVPTTVIVVHESPYRGSAQWFVTGTPSLELDSELRLELSHETYPLRAVKTALRTAHVSCVRSSSEVLETAQSSESESKRESETVLA